MARKFHTRKMLERSSFTFGLPELSGRNIDLAHRDRILDQLTSQSEKSCQMAVPPSRALLVAELPVSGRARVRVVGKKLPPSQRVVGV